MKSEIKNINNRQFLILELARINQKSHYFFLAKAPAKEIVKMFTVSPAEYDVSKYKHLTEKASDEANYYEELINDKKLQIKKSNFQREKDTSRVSQISKFITQNEYSFFPNTIICTCDLIDPEANLSIDEIIEQQYTKGQNMSFYFNHRGTEYLIIPIVPKSILVIDGQHRLEGLKKYFEDNPLLSEDFDVILSFLIDFDRAIIAQQFYTINYEQKPVNKSVLYHLMGEFSDEIDELTLLHNFVRVFNEYENSPFHNRIKMLGKTPLTFESEVKNLFSISQAFLIDELIKTISLKSQNSLYQPVFLLQFLDKTKHVEIIRFLINYFNAVREIRPDWDTPTESILSKGMGVGALVKVLQFLIPMLSIDNYGNDLDKVISLEKDELKGFLSGLQNVDLNQFSGQGSAGSISKIKEKMIEHISYFGNDNYQDFEENFKEAYLPKFKNWMKLKIK